jgi:hypothetical protein
MGSLRTDSFQKQATGWPATGRHILAQYDDESVVVYQAFQPSIGLFSAEAGYLGRGFSLQRISWIRTSFLWMMTRSAWGTREGQQVVLAIWLKRAAFDQILTQAVSVNFDEQRYEDREQWRAAVEGAEVRMQWDPDYDPVGQPTARRAIQLGLHGSVLANYARPWIHRIENISGFVGEQRERLLPRKRAALITPTEHSYPCEPELAQKLGIEQPRDP